MQQLKLFFLITYEIDLVDNKILKISSKEVIGQISDTG
jgi:hypothetical protein